MVNVPSGSLGVIGMESDWSSWPEVLDSHPHFRQLIDEVVLNWLKDLKHEKILRRRRKLSEKAALKVDNLRGRQLPAHHIKYPRRLLVRIGMPTCHVRLPAH